MKRPSPASMILGLCLTAMAGLLGYQQYQLIQLRSGVDSAAEKTSLEAILARLNRVDERLDAVDGQHLVSNEDFRSGQQALSNRIDAAQAFAKQASDAVEPGSNHRLGRRSPGAQGYSGDAGRFCPHAAREASQGSAADRASTEARCLPCQAQAETQANRASALLNPRRGVSRGRTVSVGCTSGIHPAQPDLPHSPGRCRRRHDLATDRP